MKGTVLILRPEPGASATAARAIESGLLPRLAPLFTIRPLPWRPPEPAGLDALLLTSANAARQAGAALRLFTRLPCYAVGEATAKAARDAGFGDVRTGPGDGEAATAMMAADGIRCVLHLCGRDHVALVHPSLRFERRIVYAADPVATLPPAAAEAVAAGAIVLIHSPRAAALLGALVPSRGQIRLAAISAPAAEAAGEGWLDKAVATAPRDEALLELAAKLCQNGVRTPRSTRDTGGGRDEL